MTTSKGRIFFVYPPAPVMNREDRCQQPTTELMIIPPLPPLDMMTLSAIAKKQAYETKFKDYSLKKENVHDFIRDVLSYKPDYIVLNIASTVLERDLSVLKPLKDAYENVVVIVKGAIFNFKSAEILQKYKEIDIALKGDIEESFEEIIQKKDLKEIKGIIYQKNNEIITTPQREVKPDLNFLPIPDRDLIDNNFYTRPDTQKPQTIIRVSKGCPNNCFFCLATPLNGAKVRYRSTDSIIKEIEECMTRYKIFDFIFWSDIFNLDNNWVKDLCNKITDKKLKIRFSTNTRADTPDFQTLKLMKKAGCTLVSIGIESGSQEMLDKMGKKITLEQVENAVDMAHKAGLQTYAYYVLGLPWETKETIEETFSFAKRLNTHYASFYTATALIGTRYWDYVQKNRLGEVSYDKPYIYPSVRSYELSESDIYNYNKQFDREYYLRPRYIIKMALGIRSIRQIKLYFDTFIRFMKQH